MRRGRGREVVQPGGKCIEWRRGLAGGMGIGRGVVPSRHHVTSCYGVVNKLLIKFGVSLGLFTSC